MWTETGANEFSIYYTRNGSETNPPLYTITTTLTSHVIPALDSNTEYRIWISARNYRGRTNSSDVHVSTLPEGTKQIIWLSQL